MTNTIIKNSTSINNYSSLSNLKSSKIELSAELQEYIKNSGTEGKKLLKALKSLCKNGESLSSLTSSDTSSEATTTYNNGNKDINTLVSSFNNLLKYSKNNSDNPKLSKLYKSLKNYVSKETDSLKQFGITVKSTGSLSISNSITLKNSIADGSLGNYILTQSKSSNSFLGRLQRISKIFSYNSLSYLSNENIEIVNSYNNSSISNVTNNNLNKSDTNTNIISYYA